MLSGVIPFSPDDFDYRNTTLVTTSTVQKLLVPDPTRRYVKIATIGLTVAVNPTFSFGEGPATNKGIPGSTTVPVELTWFTHYNMTCLEIWQQGYNVGTTFSIIEVLYSPIQPRGLYDATRKPETLATKIKRAYSSFRSSS